MKAQLHYLDCGKSPEDKPFELTRTWDNVATLEEAEGYAAESTDGLTFERTVHIPGIVSNYHAHGPEVGESWTLTVYHDQYLADAAKYARPN